MTEEEHQQVIDELERVIVDTRETLERFEATGMDQQMPEEYGQLFGILDRAVKEQRTCTLAMLAGDVTMAGSLVPPSPLCPPST